MSQIENKNSNPLAGFFRQPRIYITLPSKGQFYPNGSLDMPESGEIPVYAMTARDELMFKTPDALMNGTSTVEVIKSCLPNIKNPWLIPSIDLDAILCAIRIATYGHEMEVSSTCPKCESHNDHSIDLRAVLDNFKNIQFRTKVVIEDIIVVNLQPLNYDQISKAGLKAFEHQKIFSVINDSSINDEQKVKLFQESFVKLTDLTFETVAQCITSIESPNGATSDKEFITEFLRNTDKRVFNELNKVLEDTKKSATMPSLEVECSDCKHSYQIALTLDHSDFFGKGF